MPARVQNLGENKPKLGSFSLSLMSITLKKPRFAFLFGSCGEYG